MLQRLPMRAVVTPGRRYSAALGPTLITSAPRSASTWVMMLPATKWERSSTRTSSSGQLACGSKAWRIADDSLGGDGRSGQGSAAGGPAPTRGMTRRGTRLGNRAGRQSGGRRGRWGAAAAAAYGDGRD